MTNFSGAWEMNVTKSTLRRPAPKLARVVIEHSESKLIQRVIFHGADGVERQQTFEFEIGVEATNPLPGGEVKTRARWEGPVLVIESWMKTRARDAYFNDHWSLSADGQTLTMSHHDDDLAGQVSVLEKTV